MSMFDGMGGNPEMQKMMLAQALMGGGQQGGPQNSFAGGLASGISPMMRAMMMQKMMAAPQPQAMPQQPGGLAQQQGQPSGGNQPGFFGRLGNMLFGPSTIDGAPPNGAIVARAGTPEAAALDGDQGSVTINGVTYGPKFIQGQ